MPVLRIVSVSHFVRAKTVRWWRIVLRNDKPTVASRTAEISGNQVWKGFTPTGKTGEPIVEDVRMRIVAPFHSFDDHSSAPLSYI